jgi:hypothetical protein
MLKTLSSTIKSYKHKLNHENIHRLLKQMMLFYLMTPILMGNGYTFSTNWIRFISAKSCSVDFPVSKLILNKYSQLVYETSTKPVAIQNLNLLYKKTLFSRDRKGVWLSNQCSIVNRINLSTIEKKFGTRVRYAYIGRLCQRLTDFYKFYENLTSPILFGVQLIKAIFVTKKFWYF